MIQENEIPKYLKSTESNISKSNRKSKHKHHYEECLNKYLEYKNESYIMNDEFERYVFALNMRDDNNEDNFYYIFNIWMSNYNIFNYF